MRQAITQISDSKRLREYYEAWRQINRAHHFPKRRPCLSDINQEWMLRIIDQKIIQPSNSYWKRKCRIYLTKYIRCFLSYLILRVMLSDIEIWIDPILTKDLEALRYYLWWAIVREKPPLVFSRDLVTCHVLFKVIEDKRFHKLWFLSLLVI